jgi:hypothetical protein
MTPAVYCLSRQSVCLGAIHLIRLIRISSYDEITGLTMPDPALTFTMLHPR